VTSPRGKGPKKAPPWRPDPCIEAVDAMHGFADDLDVLAVAMESEMPLRADILAAFVVRLGHRVRIEADAIHARFLGEKKRKTKL
jgi:hypothetical protein